MLSFDEYVSVHGPALLKFAHVLTGDSFRAEDLTQTVLVHVFVKWARISQAKDPHAYVRRMVVNAHLDWHRRRSSTEHATSAEVIDRSMSSLVVPDMAVELVTRDELRRMVSALPPRSRTVLVLRYYNDLDDRTIADAMGIKVGSVRSLAARALETLRQSEIRKGTS